MALFNLEDGEAVAEVVLVFLPVPVLVVPARVVVVDEEAIGSSFFCAHELRNATVASAMTKVKTDVFIGVVKLNEPENVDLRLPGQALNRDRHVTFLCFIIPN